jgi:hypothetical protein
MESIEITLKEGTDINKVQSHLLKNQFIKKCYIVTMNTLRIYYSNIEAKCIVKAVSAATSIDRRKRKPNIQHIKNVA